MKSLYNIPKPYIIYDTSINDLKIRKENAILFNTAKECAIFLGLSKTEYLIKYASIEAIKSNKRFKCKRNGISYAIRQYQGNIS